MVNGHYSGENEAMLPTDYEDEERANREAAKRERLIDKADHDRDREKYERE